MDERGVSRNITRYFHIKVTIDDDRLSPICILLIARFKFCSFRLDTFTESLARLSIGPLVNEITEHFLSVILGGKFYKMKLYSCHDTTIASLMNGLGLNFDDLPPYTSTLIFEIHAGNFSIYCVRFVLDFWLFVYFC